MAAVTLTVEVDAKKGTAVVKDFSGNVDKAFNDIKNKITGA